MELVLHIVIVLNVFQHSATLPGHDGSVKNPQNAFLNDPKCQKGGFGHFSDLGLLDQLDIAYHDRNLQKSSSFKSEVETSDQSHVTVLNFS